ncbi:helix-turn-helix transcriptional regulator [Terricaulis sp.]|uniref:helix-turn-helix transcriptional regulator n=1 Tax=Terricaulis sp. TaxID=2768686 RepID=UPI003A0FEB3C
MPNRDSQHDRAGQSRRSEGAEVTRPLPFDCPRGLNRVQAAAYVGVSPTTFDRLVAEGVMPRAKEIGARRVYDRAQLDQAFDALGEGAEAGRNDWDG